MKDDRKVGSAVSADDDEVLRRSSTQEPEAFGVLVGRHTTGVLRFLMRRTADRAMAEDLVQETFLRAYSARRAWRSEGSVLGWLLTIARRLLISRMRRLRRRLTVPLEGASERELQSRIGVPEETVLRRERHDAVRREVLRLRPKHRDVIVLWLHGELHYTRMAGLLGTTEARVRQRVFHAKEALEGRLHEFRPGEGAGGRRRTAKG
ncbi:MAG: sigma-70 family RNA polymerase sigma factor [Candidatus Wallbacteria bacterium]|nr:sigma-70 family RNA polymerase sigma factor [Candidatus Wallbacteria bacterium]